MNGYVKVDINLFYSGNFTNNSKLLVNTFILTSKYLNDHFLIVVSIWQIV